MSPDAGRSPCYLGGVIRTIAAALGACLLLAAQAPRTFTNPLLPSGADPFIAWREGFYYFTATGGRHITIRKSASLAGLAAAESREIWRAPDTGPYSRDIWAPELHYLRGKWYVYFAADAGANASHRIWVLENSSADPLAGEWVLKGKVADATDRWAIDATVFESAARLYMIWSGWEGDTNVAQNLYIAELSDPWTVKSPRVRISSPEYPWEKAGDLKPRRDPEENPGRNTLDPVHVDVNEGPAVLVRNGRIFVTYSASGCWTDFYALGLLTANQGDGLLDAKAWRKSPLPVFWQSPAAGAYGTGHNSFFQSPDGREDWILYHANPQASQGCGGRRSPRAQRFTWNPDGTPDFGRPVKLGEPLAAPSGER
ncbi:MAG: glycoside hydrolase family 43 protein [Acidobacteriota bacterium]|nr:glycoside hydrolase family 43 protein [Acidobacteriota bacterium]